MKPTLAQVRLALSSFYSMHIYRGRSVFLLLPLLFLTSYCYSFTAGRNNSNYCMNVYNKEKTTQVISVTSVCWLQHTNKSIGAFINTLSLIFSKTHGISNYPVFAASVRKDNWFCTLKYLGENFTSSPIDGTDK